MTIENTAIDAVKRIQQFRSDDRRGTFVKTFHSSSLREAGIHFDLRESFYSVSCKDVIRGMHFHLPPHAHAKIVFCTSGSILDVALDLRPGSATYGKAVSQVLSFENNIGLYIPNNFAHGFLTLSKEATTYYLVDGEYHSGADHGIRYDSFNFDWPVSNPIVSDRDALLKHFSDFISPF